MKKLTQRLDASQASKDVTRALDTSKIVKRKADEGFVSDAEQKCGAVWKGRTRMLVARVEKIVSRPRVFR